jgi:hypothetical protein
MEKATLDHVLERLELLEREKRQLLIVVLVLFGTTLGAVALGTDLVRPARVAEAERFVLKDSRGRVRAQLGTDADGSPKLSLMDDRGRDQVALRGLTDADGSLELYDRGQLRVAMAASPGGTASLDFYDKSHRGRAGMYLWPDGTTEFGLRAGDKAVELAAQPDGLAGLSVSDADGSVHGRMGSLPDDLLTRGPYGPVGQRPFRRPRPNEPENTMKRPALAAPGPRPADTAQSEEPATPAVGVAIADPSPPSYTR